MSRMLLYAVEHDATGARVQSVIEGLVSDQELEVHRSIESLTFRLHSPRESLRIVTLVPASQDEFLAIVSLRDLLRDYRTILFLPDDSEISVGRGLSLYPRFLAPHDLSSHDLSAVLNRMLQVYATDSWAPETTGILGGQRR